MKNINDMTDEDIMVNAIRFALSLSSKKESDPPELKRPDFQKTKHTFITCVKWLRENYQNASPDMGTFVSTGD